jgi:hypothetical protein
MRTSPPPSSEKAGTPITGRSTAGRDESSSFDNVQQFTQKTQSIRNY